MNSLLLLLQKSPASSFSRGKNDLYPVLSDSSRWKAWAYFPLVVVSEARVESKETRERSSSPSLRGKRKPVARKQSMAWGKRKENVSAAGL